MYRTRLAGLLLVTMLLVAACGGAPATQAPTAATAPEATAAPAATSAPEATAAPAATSASEATAAPAATSAPAPTPKPAVSTLTVKLKSGLKWSDGSPVTSKDLVGTYDIFWAQGGSAWAYLTDVVAKDDQTVEFQINTPSLRVERLILRSFQPAPYSQYGKFMDQAHQLRMKNLATDSPEVKKFNDDLLAFKPTDAVVYGPYKIDPSSITEAQMKLVKNPTGYNADKIDFDSVLIYYGETAASVPLMLSGDLDYSTHGYTPADLQSIQQLPNVKIIKGPSGTGPGLWFNESVAPLDKKEVRQAFAYIIDRAENAKVALGEAAQPIKYEAGFTDLQVPNWLSKDAIDKLNPYNKDLKKAEELLTSVGFKKGSDGKWVDDTGKPLKFELSVPSDFADWLGAAENASQQLNAFGFDTSVRGYQSSERAKIQKEGSYQILVDLSIYYNPPYPFTSYNYYMNTPRNNPEATDNLKGMNWPWKQKTADGKDVYIPDLLKEASTGTDIEQQKPAVAQLAQILNDQLPVLALFERYATDPINTDRVTGWLPLDNKVYQNNQGADNYTAIQFLDGTLKPGPSNTDKSFHTSYPYPQPPNYSLNFFDGDNGLTENIGEPGVHLLRPPLFWYMLADQKYVPVIAESYEIKDIK